MELCEFLSIWFLSQQRYEIKSINSSSLRDAVNPDGIIEMGLVSRFAMDS